MNLPNNPTVSLQMNYNVRGVPSSGVRPMWKRMKAEGSKDCACGRTISANKQKCFACSEAKAA